MLEPEIRSKIDKLWNAFWAGGLANPLTAIEQMSYLIFMKRLEDLDIVHRRRAEARREESKSVYRGHEDCRWSKWKHMSADAMYKHVTDTVFPFIKNLHDGEEVLYSRYMRDATFMIPKPSLLQEAVSIIDEIEIGERPDIQGDVYEHLLGELKTSGKNGQFRTPRHIIRMMVELVDPDIGQRICDPACGTGGFLIAAYQHILRKYTSPDMVKVDPDGTPHNLIGDKIVKKEQWKLLWEETFYGFDFDITMIRIALMNMILHGIVQPNIEQRDTVSKQFDQNPAYDVVLANPPFAGYVDKADINDNFRLDTTKTELLFLELFYNLLAIGGRGAVIVPAGVLSGTSAQHLMIRKVLVDKCDLSAVITMPPGVFRPYSRIGTAILIFTKGGTTQETWFCEMNNDGYSLDENRHPIPDNDIPLLLRMWVARGASNISWSADHKQLVENGYNLQPTNYRRIETKSKGMPISEAKRSAEELRTEISTFASLLGELEVASAVVNAVKVPLKEILREESRPENVEAEKLYRLLGVRWYGKGVFVKEEKRGSEIKAKRLYRVKTGDFIYSRLFAWKGSFDVVDEEFDGCYASNEFPVFSVKDGIDIEPAFLKYYFKLPSSWQLAGQLSSGTTKVSRNRLKQEDLLQLSVPVPEKKDRSRIVALLSAVERISAGLAASEATACALLDGLVARVFEDIRTPDHTSNSPSASRVHSDLL